MRAVVQRVLSASVEVSALLNSLHGRSLLGILVETSRECSFWVVAGGGASSVGDRPWTPHTRRRPRGGHRLRRRLHV